MKLVRAVQAVVRVVTSERVYTTRAVADEALEAAEVSQASGPEPGMNETGAAEHVHVRRILLLSVEIDF